MASRFTAARTLPPKDGYGRPSFKRVLLSIAQAYREKHGDVVEQASMVESAIARAESYGGGGTIAATVIDAIVESAQKMFDEANGGFGGAPKFPHPAALDLLMEQYTRTGDDALRHIFVHTLQKMALGGVYDQLAGGFHRYSVDERWIVPHFEKMSYDNSELLKNYVRAWQATGDTLFAAVARDIIRWVDEWLSDSDHGGFYASQDADYSMDDDGDYFTWTLDETRSALSQDEARVAELYYDIGDIGEMHHDPAKNVLYVRAGVAEIARRLELSEARVHELLESAKKKMYAARLRRPTPYVDKTVYVGWNAMFISAYLEAANVLDLDETRRFALRSLDRLLAEGWNPARGLKHVIAYSDPKAESRETTGVLDDYAFTVNACLDAYESTADLSYFRFARAIADFMVAGFFDQGGGGFFDTRIVGAAAGEATKQQASQGILGTRRKPFQDSPTPAGNSVAAIALLRMHGYSNQASDRELAEQTLEVYAGVAGQHGIFAASYGLAIARFTALHTQVVIIGKDEAAAELCRAARRGLSLTRAVVQMDADKAVSANLPPALAETIPNLPTLAAGRSFAVVCSEAGCQPPVFEVEELLRLLSSQARKAA